MRDVLSALTSLENQSSNVGYKSYVSRLRNFLLCNIKDCQFTGDQKCVLKCSWCCELFSDYSVLLSLYKKYFILVCLEVAAKLGSSKAVGNNRPSCHLCDLHLAYTSLHHFCLVLRDGPHDHRFPHSVYGFIEKPNCKSCTHILKRKVIPLFWGKGMCSFVVRFPNASLGKNPSGLCDDHVSSHEEKRFRVFKKNHSTLSHLRKWIRRSESSSDSCDSYSLKGENKPVKDNPLDCLKAESIPHQRLSPLNDSKCIDVNLLHSYIDKHLTTELPQPCLYPHVLVILCKYINAIQFIIHMDESYSVHYGDALAHFNINILEELQNVTKSVYEMFISTRDDFYLSVVQIVCQAITVVYDCLKYWKKSVVHLNYDTSLLDFITLISQWFHSNESKFMPLKLTSLDILLNVINLTSQCTDVYNRCHNMIINFLNNIQTTEKHIHELLCMTNDFNSNVHSEYIADYFMCLFHKLYQSDQSLLQHTPPPPIQDSPCIINKEFPYLFVLLHSFVSQSKCLTVDENTTTTTNTTPPNTYALVTYRSFLSFMHNHALSICSVYMLNEYFVQWIFDMLFELYFSTSSFIIFNHFKSNNNNNNELRNHLYFKIIYAFLIDLVKKEKFAWLKDVLFKLTRNDNSFVKKTSFLHELCQIHNDIITALISTRRSDLCYANIILNDHLMQNFLTCLFNQINTADSCLSSDYYPECAHNLLESYTILLGVKIQMLHSNKFSMSLNFWQDSLNTAKDIKSPNFLLRRLVNMLTMPWNRPSLKFSDHNQLSLIQEHEKLQSYLTDFTIQLFSDVFNQSEHLLYTSQFIGQNKVNLKVDKLRVFIFDLMFQ
ncbi:unnamed protein product [Trichobilharzia regenti]|nr:unnamed protein product [Trichobilharzia regenti]